MPGDAAVAAGAARTFPTTVPRLQRLLRCLAPEGEGIDGESDAELCRWLCDIAVTK